MTNYPTSVIWRLCYACTACLKMLKQQASQALASEANNRHLQMAEDSAGSSGHAAPVCCRVFFTAGDGTQAARAPQAHPGPAIPKDSSVQVWGRPCSMQRLAETSTCWLDRPCSRPCSSWETC